jgi:hypothetical protein
MSGNLLFAVLIQIQESALPRSAGDFPGGKYCPVGVNGIFLVLRRSFAMRKSGSIGALSITGGRVAGVRSLGLNLMCLDC